MGRATLNGSGGGRFVIHSFVGAKELLRTLEALPVRVERKIMRTALREAAKVVQAAAKQEAPKDTGDLADSIVVRAAKKLRRGQVGVEVRTEAGFFQGDQFYAGFIEFGFNKQPTVPLPGGGFASLPRGEGVPEHVPANPFMRRAADEAGPYAGQLAEQLIAEGIEKAARAK